MTTDNPTRVLFYVQHLLGIGHLARASRIATALKHAHFDVTLVTGGAPVVGFPAAGTRHVELPPVVAGKSGFSQLEDLEGNPVDDAFMERRRDVLLETFRSVRPEVVIIEAYPFGRRQVRLELKALLAEAAASTPRPLVVTSLRDILQAHTKPERNRESVELVQGFFDAVLVHGDPAFVRLDDTFPLAQEIAGQVVYTGLVAPAPSTAPADAVDVVVSAGGGAVGHKVLQASLAAARALPQSLSWCLIAGPNLPQGEFDNLVATAPGNARVERFRADFVGLLSGARLSVSQAGYNTVCDVLVAGCRAVLVPFAAGGETEQTTRALRLERMGLAKVLFEDALTPELMTAAVAEALACGRPGEGVGALKLDGARQTADLLRHRLERSTFPATAKG